MCSAASNPMRDNADCSRPRIQAIPSDQPFSFWKSVKTKDASFLSDVARSTMLIITTPNNDQYSAASFQRPRILLPNMFAPVVNVTIARNIRYVRHAWISYVPPDAMTAAAWMNCAAYLSCKRLASRGIPTLLTSEESFGRHERKPPSDARPADPKALVTHSQPSTSPSRCSS